MIRFFLLSYYDYFRNISIQNLKKTVRLTDYSLSNGLYAIDDEWNYKARCWTRSPYPRTSSSSTYYFVSCISRFGDHDGYQSTEKCGIRPSIKINLS